MELPIAYDLRDEICLKDNMSAIHLPTFDPYGIGFEINRMQIDTMHCPVRDKILVKKTPPTTIEPR